MNVLLLNILANIEEQSLNSAPPGIAYIGAMIENIGHTVKVLSLTPMEIVEGDWQQALENFSPNIAGSTLITCQYYYTMRFLEKVKSICPSVYTVVGGPHAAALPGQVIKEPCIDFVVRGEGEYVIQNLIFALESHKDFSRIPGIFFKTPSHIIRTPNTYSIKDLDLLPFPAWHLFPTKKSNISLYQQNKLGVMGSRGCPFNCIYCYRGPSSSKAVRYRSLKNIFDEIKYFKKKYPFDGVTFWDDVFTLDRQRTKDFCIQFSENFPDLTWSCQTRIDRLDEGLLELMEASGCRFIRLGIESGDDKTLRLINKGISASLIKHNFALIKQRRRIRTKTYFILGFPWDTYGTIKKSISFAKDLSADQTMFLIATPYPGTQLYNSTKENLLANQHSWSEYNHFCDCEDIIPFYNIPGISNRQLVDLIRKLNNELNTFEIPE